MVIILKHLVFKLINTDNYVTVISVSEKLDLRYGLNE